MAFPFNSQDQMLSEQAILAGVADVSAGEGVLRVSTITQATTTFDGDAANNRVSAIQEGANRLRISAIQGDGANLNVSAKSQDAGTLLVSAKQGDAALLRMSAIGLSLSFNGDAANNRVSAIQADAANLMVSSKSNDAALFRVSAIGGTAGDNIIVDGSDQTVSARIKQISAVLSASDNAFIVHSVSEGAHRNRISAIQDGAGALNVSAKSNDGALFRTSAVQDGAAALNVSAKSNDGALLRTSAVQDGAAALNVSAKSNDAGTMLVSAKQGDAGLLLVSAKQGDGANLRISAFQTDAANLNVSAKSGDAGTFLVSAKSIVDARAAGGASIFSTSAGIAQLSAIKQSGGRLYGYHLTHGAGVDQYLLVFNASATSAVTLGTTVPDLMLGVPAGTGANAGGGAVQWLGDAGAGFANGITLAVVSAVNGTTAGASAMRVNLFYA